VNHPVSFPAGGDSFGIALGHLVFKQASGVPKRGFAKKSSIITEG
jgi:hypothetical protein